MTILPAVFEFLENGISYLQTPMFNKEQASLLLALRTRAVCGVCTDFGDMFVDKRCPLACGDQNTLENFMKCDKYDIQEERRHIFFVDLEQRKAATTLFSELLEMRELLLEEARQLGQCTKKFVKLERGRFGCYNLY